MHLCSSCKTTFFHGALQVSTLSVPTEGSSRMDSKQMFQQDHGKPCSPPVILACKLTLTDHADGVQYQLLSRNSRRSSGCLRSAGQGYSACLSRQAETCFSEAEQVLPAASLGGHTGPCLSHQKLTEVQICHLSGRFTQTWEDC